VTCTVLWRLSSATSLSSYLQRWRRERLGRIPKFWPKRAVHDVKAASFEFVGDHVPAPGVGVCKPHEVQGPAVEQHALHRDVFGLSLSYPLCFFRVDRRALQSEVCFALLLAGCIAHAIRPYCIAQIVRRHWLRSYLLLYSWLLLIQVRIACFVFLVVCPTHHNKQIVLTLISPVPRNITSKAYLLRFHHRALCLRC